MTEGATNKHRMHRWWPERKARLLVCAVCRQALPSFAPPLDRELRSTVETVEAYADGHLTAADLTAARERGLAAVQRSSLTPELYEIARAVVEAARVGAPTRLRAHTHTFNPHDVGNLVTVVYGFLELLADDRLPVPVPCDVLFDDLEPHPQPLEATWRTETVTAIAAQMYESRDFSAMPILADALQDAGCDRVDLLEHCRSGTPHHRGCWAADLALGRDGLYGPAWATSRDPWTMLDALAPPLPSRKLRLFAAAWARRLVVPGADPRIGAAIECAERHADGAATDDELATHRATAGEAFEQAPAPLKRCAEQTVAAASAAADEAAQRTLAPYTYSPFGDSPDPGPSAIAELAGVVRCLSPGPCVPPRFDPAWRTVPVAQLAARMYRSRDFHAMPLLAERLRDAGCDRTDLLAHCRDTGATHARGCWALDLVLGHG